MINIIICEDDPRQNRYLEDKLRGIIKEDYQIYSYLDEKEMFKSCANLKGCCIFFMDIVLKESSGIIATKYINEHFPRSVVIYVSAYLNKVTDIFDTQHSYFIYKPELDDRLEIALNKAIEEVINLNKTLSFKYQQHSYQLNIDDIYSIERNKRVSLIKCEKQFYHCPLDFEEITPFLHKDFVQCHRSYMVNLNHVLEHTRTDFILNNNESIPISRSYSKKSNQLFINF
ncbi:MAG: LytTR family DNA-binding domain-containing protein [Bacilli bacterium]|nr:LytTR family DNA-binding domain-containing protein [Bacilli bacterium]